MKDYISAAAELDALLPALLDRALRRTVNEYASRI
jgi:hypothetical protein